MANVQIRNVSPATHRRLKELARGKGQSLSEYLRGELERLAELPTWEEMEARIRRRGRVKLDAGVVAQAIREERESR